MAFVLFVEGQDCGEKRDNCGMQKMRCTWTLTQIYLNVGLGCGEPPGMI
jgi:hypothetical protein